MNEPNLYAAPKSSLRESPSASWLKREYLKAFIIIVCMPMLAHSLWMLFNTMREPQVLTYHAVLTAVRAVLFFLSAWLFYRERAWVRWLFLAHALFWAAIFTREAILFAPALSAAKPVMPGMADPVTVLRQVLVLHGYTCAICAVLTAMTFQYFRRRD